ncbi:MAG: hypothetical protein QOG82_1373 [Actinomycetota bacterium]|jgi:hypothetical protein|nr:hypothetical protein [Actinomycetota bacterium]
MSRMLLTKLDVDVLVQLAVLGPLEAELWKPLVDDADAFGRELWTLNWAAAAHLDEDGEMPAYTFEPLPVGVTAGEGLKQVAFFVYQSADEDDEEGPWMQSRIRARLNRMRHRLLEHVPDYRDAPWGWGSGEVAARSSRAAPTPQAEPSPRLREVLELWAAVGVPIATRYGPGIPSDTFADPRRVLGGGAYLPPKTSGFAPVLIVVCADEDASRHAFLLMAQGAQYAPNSHVYRFRDVVARVALGTDDGALSMRLEEAIDQLSQPDRLGEPADHWWSAGPPRADVAAEVVASRVRLNPATAGTHLAEHVLVARTPAQQRALVAMLADDDVRIRAAAVSTRDHSLLLLRGVAEIESASNATVRDEVFDRGSGPAMGQRLSLYTSGATSGYATLVLVGRLPVAPQMVWIEDPGLRRGLLADTP